MTTQYGIEQILSTYTLSDGTNVYNLAEAVYVDPTSIAPGLFNDHYVQQGEALTTISYKYYTTIDLWWLVYACNRDIFDNPVFMPSNGTKIRIPTTQLVQLILTSAND